MSENTKREHKGKDHKVKYDLDNRIIKVNIDNTDVKYCYDALGRRVIRKQKSVTKTALIWWGNSECAEYKHNSAELGRWLARDPIEEKNMEVIKSSIFNGPPILAVPGKNLIKYFNVRPLWALSP